MIEVCNQYNISVEFRHISVSTQQPWSDLRVEFELSIPDSGLVRQLTAAQSDQQEQLFFATLRKIHQCQNSGKLVVLVPEVWPLAAVLNAYIKAFDDLILAAGGVVENPGGEVLFILFRGVWSLPKGKVDPGETIETAALREVNEETGLTELNLVRSLGNTYHCYPLNEKYVIKSTAWFHMKVTHLQQLTPQIEEQISECRWVPVSQLKKYISYRTVEIVCARYLGQMPI